MSTSSNGNFTHGKSAPPLDKNVVDTSANYSPNGADAANLKGNGLNGFSPVEKPVAKASPTPDPKGCSYVKPAPASPNDNAGSVVARPVLPTPNIGKNRK
jgi:hypothetical protein